MKTHEDPQRSSSLQAPLQHLDGLLQALRLRRRLRLAVQRALALLGGLRCLFEPLAPRLQPATDRLSRPLKGSQRASGAPGCEPRRWRSGPSSSPPSSCRRGSMCFLGAARRFFFTVCVCVCTSFERLFLYLWARLPYRAVLSHNLPVASVFIRICPEKYSQLPEAVFQAMIKPIRKSGAKVKPYICLDLHLTIFSC